MDERPPLSPAAQAELRGWMLAALTALAVAGILAPMLVLSRAPGMAKYLPWHVQAFDRAIIEHVVFSVIVWAMCIFGGFMTVAADSAKHPHLPRLGKVGLWLLVPTFILLFVPGVLTSATPSLNDYIPIMIHPLYYVGVGLLFVALSMPVARLIMNAEAVGAGHEGPIAAALSFCIALACFAIARTSLGDVAPSVAYNEDLFWGGGHVLQIINAMLLLTAWRILGREALDRPLLPARPFRIALGLALLAAAAVVLLYGVFPIQSGYLRDGQSQLKFLLAIPTLLVGIASLPALNAARRSPDGLPWRNPAFVALALSMVLFAIGGVMGFFADGFDTRTPGHYHAVLGALNLSFFGVVMFHFLPRIGRPLNPTRWRFAPLYIYAFGQALQAAGMFIAAAPRKTMGKAQMLVTMPERLGMQLNHNGGLIAVIGGILFVWLVGRALLRRLPSNPT